MALNFYCGSPGAGKSYHVVKEVVVTALLNGKNIITNLPLKMGEIHKAFPQLVEQNNYVRIINDEQVRDIHKIVDNDKYAGWIIIIDEAHNYWPSNEAMKDEDFKSWLSQHRHKMQNIVMITQDFTNINKFVRSMVQERYEFEKNESRGSEKSYMQDFFLKQSKKKVDRKICKYNPEYFKFYRSHDVGMAEAGFKEERVGKKMNLMRKPFMYAVGGVGLALVCIVFFFKSFAGSVQDEPVEALNSVSSPQMIEPINNPRKVSVSSKLDRKVTRGWCNNIMRVSAGVQGMDRSLRVQTIFGRAGSTMQGGSVRLKGAFIVVGSIEMPLKSIYFVRDLDSIIFRLKVENSIYSVGEKICL